MKPFDLYIAYIGWTGGGKDRPVLVFSTDATATYVYRITSQYGNKSDAVKSAYFPISDWRQAGLDKQSYVDVSEVFAFSPSDFANKTPIGMLTEDDKRRFMEFISTISR